MKLMLMMVMAVVVGTGMVTSCTNLTPERAQRLAGYANVALTAAEIGGAVNPKQAEAIRGGGALLLSLKAGDTDGNLQKLSETAVAYAVASGKLTVEQALELKKAGTVPLTPEVVKPEEITPEAVAPLVPVPGTPTPVPAPVDSAAVDPGAGWGWRVCLGPVSIWEGVL